MTQILIELIKLANLIINITKSIACGNRIQSVFEIKPDIISGDIKSVGSDNGAIELNNVCFSYNENSDNALSDINLKIFKGQTVGFIGAAGSGKSTLINLMPRFYDVSSGNIKIFGEDVKKYNLKTLRNIFGIVPQKAVLFKGSVRDNMKISNPDVTDSEIYDAIKIAQAEEIINNKGENLDFQIEQEGKNLSGGQKQRINIARALVRNPKILILDDSSSALDYVTDAKLRSAIKELDEEMTVIIVSQRASALRHADNIFVLDNGEIIDSGTDSQLNERCEIYREIRKTQFEEGEV